jgi:DUF4097 and DUF4098 domain-containing protein YvlB
MKTLTRTLLPIAVLLIPLAALADDLDQSWSVSANATVSVDNVAGEIDIATWDKNEVHLSGALGTGQKLEVKESSSGIRIEVQKKDGDDDYDETFLKLMIPIGASVEASGVTADITVTDSKGTNITVESVSGDIDIESESERIELTTVSGDIQFAGSASRSSVESVAGDVDIEGISGEVSFATVSGDLELEAGSVSQGKFETVSGTLNISLSVADGGRLTVEGMNGDVYLDLPAAQSAAIKAQTFSGDIESDFGDAKSESFGPGSHLKHHAGESGASIRVETFSGDIRIGHK